MSRPSRLRRLGSVLSALAAGVSLAVFVAVCVLWVRSCWLSDMWVWVASPAGAAPESRLTLLSHGGQVSLNWAGLPFDPRGRRVPPVVHETGPPVPFWSGTAGDALPAFLNRLGFGLFRTSAHAPAWSVALASLAAAGLLSRPWRWPPFRRDRVREGSCRTCGYDLRATPDRCPECGTPATPATTKGAA